MEKLKLPILKDIPESNRWLSMDDYIEFVNFNARNFRKSKVTKSDMDAMRVNVPFFIY